MQSRYTYSKAKSREENSTYLFPKNTAPSQKLDGQNVTNRQCHESGSHSQQVTIQHVKDRHIEASKQAKQMNLTQAIKTDPATYCTIPHHTMPCLATSYHAIPYHAMPHHTMPHHTMPHHIMPCHATQHHTIQAGPHPSDTARLTGPWKCNTRQVSTPSHHIQISKPCGVPKKKL
ncbi:hypothetical protein EJ05DRAFT_326526 [Pseudovirgaria hyperparasitica]|uniref:Uncharacterized protein n=1 Tax=Pseudovirgaria hyperparasitica TaxID=470096 RepID=A0A6A6WAR8_9PEZI|nr:uncharacterized protein EJ05DRAFT_326526 [Pseudovirgaria hyperparasitica]KAF2758926.1 hypothetical protein EJ05DRAFT_326526 [Pseudovirgaria hyperparasitica]